MKETDLGKIKKVAIDFLHLPIEENEQIPIFLLHPFFETRMVPVKIDGKTEFLDILESKENEKTAIKFYEELISRADSVNKILMMVRTADKRTFFQYISPYLSEKDFGNMWRNVWVMTEAPHFDINISVPQFLKNFKKVNPKYLMTEEELEEFSKLPDNVTIYRGFGNDKYYKAISWTLDYSTAVRFAKRFDANGRVYKAMIDKKHIIAFFKEEDEIIADYNKLKDVELIDDFT